MTAARDMVLALVVLGIFLFGYYLVRRLDNFIADGGFADSPAAREKHTVIIYGDPEIVEPLVRHLKEKGISYQVTGRADISENASFLAVAAVSKSDMDNLLLCSQAKRMCPDVISFAVCNDMTYKNVFDSAGISRVFTGNFEQPALLESLKGWVESNAC